MKKSRRKFLSGVTSSAGLLLAGCNSETYLPPSPRKSFVGIGETLNMSAQRLLLSNQKLVREYDWSDVSKDFPVPGTSNPEDEPYQKLLRGKFAEYRLPITGLVNRPTTLSLEDIKRLPSRSQITCHRCEMGWSAIAQWTGTPLARVLDAAGGVKPEARYVLFECFDAHWYDSIDLFDAFHPQTILAYGMNGRELPVKHGAPLRLRAERHCGWKNTKFIRSIQVLASVNHIRKGKGGYAADEEWQWYGGI